MTTTANDLITEGFGIATITTPTSAQIASALISLNNLISFMGADFLGYCIVKEAFTLTVNDPEYTIGSGGNINTTRPIKLEGCFIRDSEDNDCNLNILSTKSYNQVSNKTLQAKPEGVLYLPEYPLGKIIFDYAPDYAYEAHFDFHKPLTEFALTSTEVVLPPEYKAFLTSNLAIVIAEKWARTLNKSVYQRADDTKEVIERLIAIHKGVPEVRFPNAGTSGVPPTRSIETDSYINGGVF